MSDPTTPVDVIARAVYESKPSAHHNRKPVAWDDLPHFGWSSWQPNYLNRAATIITALSEAGWEIVRAAPEPDAPVVDRLRAAIEKYGTPEHDNRVTLNLDDLSRIAHRAGIVRKDSYGK